METDIENDLEQRSVSALNRPSFLSLAADFAIKYR